MTTPESDHPMPAAPADGSSRPAPPVTAPLAPAADPGAVPPHGFVPSYPGDPAYAPAPDDAPAKRPVKTLDVVVTIVLLVADGVLAALASFMGIFLVMASDSCGARDCNVDLITLGWLMGMILPWVALVATVVVAIVLMVRRRLAFWVPLAGAALIVLSLVAAFVVAAAAVPGSTL